MLSNIEAALERIADLDEKAKAWPQDYLSGAYAACCLHPCRKPQSEHTCWALHAGVARAEQNQLHNVLGLCAADASEQAQQDSGLRFLNIVRSHLNLVMETYIKGLSGAGAHNCSASQTQP